MWNREDLSSFGSMQTQRQRGGGGLSAAPVWGASGSVSVLLLLSNLGVPQSSSVAMVLCIFWYLQHEGGTSLFPSWMFMCSAPFTRCQHNATPYAAEDTMLTQSLLPHCTVLHVCHVLMFSVCLVIPCPLSPSGGRLLPLSSFYHVCILLRRSHPS